MSAPSSSQPRLLVVTETLGIGGTESHLIRLLPRLASSGWDVAIFCLSGRGTRAQEAEAAGIEVFSLPHVGARGSTLRYSAYVARACAKIYALIRRWCPDIVHFYLPGPYLIGAPIAIAARAPLKVMSRRSLSHYQENWPGAARLERWLHTQMDAITGNSRAVINELLAEGIAKEKVRLIYNGVEIPQCPPNRNEARRTLGLTANTLVGVVIANLHPYKGHRELIEGLSCVASELPFWRILCVGRDEGAKSELESLVAARQLEANVKFIGERSDVGRFLAIADFGLLTSRHEAFSNAILEGMAAGLPMIVTDVGGNAEAVINGETGLVVPLHTPEKIGEAVLHLARDPCLRRRLGAAGRSRANQEFSMDSCVAAHLALYEELLANTRPTI